MKFKIVGMFMAIASLILTLGCSQSQKSPDVKADIEKALGQAGFRSISVSQDRDKGVVTLAGDVQTEADKQRAEDIARSISNSLVVSNQIGVRPSGFETEAKKVDSSLDTAIEKNLEAILIGKRLDQDIKYAAKNGVLTLSGEVDSINKRHEIEQLASSVPNVKQVVNELQITGIKATSRK
jgi:hyperosmotically inducible periplasmic protein